MELISKINAQKNIAAVPFLFLAYFLEKKCDNTNFIFICPETKLAESLYKHIISINPNNKNILYLPAWDSEPELSPSIQIQAKRISVLNALLNNDKISLICTIDTLKQKLSPLEYVIEHSYTIKKGDLIDLEKLCSSLVRSAYIREDLVEELGSFSLRGNILDIFTGSNVYPFRIEFIGDLVNKIKLFDLNTQKSVKEVENIVISPVRELSINDDKLVNLKQQFKDFFDTNNVEKIKREEIIAFLENGFYFSGIEYYLSFFHEKLNTIFDYLSKKTQVFTYDSFLFSSLIEEKEESNLPYPKTQLFLNEDELSSFLKLSSKNFYSIDFKETADIYSYNDIIVDQSNLKLDILKAKQNNIELINVVKDHHLFLKQNSYKVIYCVKNKTQARRLKFFLEEVDEAMEIKDTLFSDFEAINSSCILCNNLKHGFFIPLLKLSVICEEDLFNEKIEYDDKTTSSDFFLNSFKDLNINDAVIQSRHGIGIYRGLKKISVDNVTSDFFEIEYLRGDKLYLPIYRLNTVQKYLAATDINIKLDKLGGASFSARKVKAKQNTIELAKELLEIQTKRKALKGFAFSHENQLFTEFEEDFPFEETPDQKKSIDAVILDMEKDTPMDRLICGDVGFGKTEIAIRASFKACIDNKQTVVLVPTTLLAYQHYHIFTQRLKNYPVKIEYISRFKNKVSQNKILSDLKNGEIDIIIGTHRLLSSDVIFENLGLLVVDEEHRFGVKHKEKILSLSKNVDLLTLTATPIPRTLNFALLGLKDLSIIATPPINRLSIKTYISKSSPNLIRKAILSEIRRGGQVFYLNNRVLEIPELYDNLKNLVPEARITFAHGQMKENELEDVMLSFYRHDFDVLICTTIIESGIDIPNTNTIIINRADRFGLSQLYQIRGRVGRAQKQAYCYLLLPNNFKVSEQSMERIKILEKFTKLGSGFNVASYDLEYRGAGEILGSKQSGFINDIGLEEYMNLLEDSIRVLKGEISKLETNKDLEISIKEAAYIPNEYISNNSQRLYYYKKISSSKNDSQVVELEDELVDRYGKIPQELKNLFYVIKIKQILEPYDVSQVKIGEHKIILQLNKNTKFNPDKTVELLNKNSKKYKLSPDLKLIFNIDDKNKNNAIYEITELIRLIG